MTDVAVADRELIELPIRQIRPYPANPREHPQRQIEMLAKSISKYGFNVPVLVAPDHELIAGHGRLEAAKALGFDTVPAIVLAHLTAAQRRAYRIADNALSLKGSWSLELLATEMQALVELDVEFDPVDLGFETAEFDGVLSNASGTALSDQPVPEPDRCRPATSRPGDLWVIGGVHRVLCGDARDPAAYQQLLGNERAAAVVSDMPYNVPVEGHVCGLGKVHHREFAMASGEMTVAQFEDFMDVAFGNAVMFSRPGSVHFQFIDWRSVARMIMVGERRYEQLLNLCVWVKRNAGMGALWRSQHELVCAFRAPGGKHINNVQLGKHGRNRSNIWSYDGVNSFRAGRLEDLKAHPTCKPIDLVADAIQDVTNRRDLVLDPFLGSGTTLIAAHATGRRGAGLEIDPYFVDTAVTRIAERSGLPVQHEDGRSFETVRDSREGEA
ncbi:putative methyltransferase [Sphingomonas changbaiensis NBRC 104936]|uniref:Methyltransferase n=1 Tax=Sphingomonas changbaiensis NBRC 104936 TaxID=1219043 RepID=A0A0E9MTS7_9SPHN|nr:DNA methyltransferase [Sphingomonas changbaiensis]GAO40964.1 putative methyltransferase [Sphingomonas changbaiensis NBRC 104936]